MRVVRFLGGAMLVAVTTGCSLFAVDVGSLVVTVLDADEQPIPGVAIEVHYAVDPERPRLGSSLASSSTTDETGSARFTLEDGGYDVRIVATGYEPYFDRTESRTTVSDELEMTVTFTAFVRQVRVSALWEREPGAAESGGLGGVVLELVDEAGTVRRSGTTSSEGSISWGVPPAPHTLRVIEYPEWVQFTTTTFGADTSEDDVRHHLLAQFVGERSVEARVTTNEGPLEGATIDFLSVANRQRVAGGVTDAAGIVRWLWPPRRGFIARLSGFDAGVHTFARTEVALDIDDPPGPYIALFEGTTTTPTNQPPVASITTPTDGTVFTQGQPAIFTGTGVDAEDGFLTGSALVWNSSLDGAIGDGASITISTLQPGGHEITLTATDADGAADADTIDVTISASGTATIQGAVTVSGGGFANIRVTATGPTLATTVTDPFGNYTLGGLAAGTYTVTVSEYPSDFTFNPASVTVTVADGATVTRDFMGSGG